MEKKKLKMLHYANKQGKEKKRDHFPIMRI